MSVRRALVDCVVLSLQDSSVFYPSCKGCFSRIDVEQRDTERCRCSRCGYLCLREQVEYRYRLSLRVTRDRHIFGVTVFGSHLNKFFGVDATGLQRLVGNTDCSAKASEKFTLLLKAIEDCFIGRHFIFCMKLTENDRRPWIEDPAPKCRKDVTQFIVNQMILPKATGLGGCTVLTYFQKLLQKASDPNRASRYPATQLLLTPRHSPASSFNVTLSSPRFLFKPTHRPQHLDCSLTPTPPWQQSLGVVTSSAEQEESRSPQNSRQTDNSAMPHWVGMGFLQKHKAAEETSPFHLDQSLSCPSFTKCPNLRSQKSLRTSSTLNTSFTQPDHRRHSAKEAQASTEELTGTLPSSSVDWEDLPLSESLTDFICGGNKDFVVDTAPNTNVLCQKNMERNNAEITNLATESTCADQRNIQLTENHSQILLNVINIPNGHDRRRHSDQVCKDLIQQENQSQTRSICSSRFDQQNELKPSFQNEEQDLIEDAYNCSADLFGNSSLADTRTEMLSWKAETVCTTAEVSPLSLEPDLKPLIQSPGETRRPNSRRSCKRDSLTIQDFVPPSQSTPNVKRFVSHSFISLGRKLTHEFTSLPERQDPEAFLENMCELKHKKAVNTASAHPQLNSLDSAGHRGQVCTKENLIWSTTPTRCSNTRSTRQRLGKPEEHKTPLPTHKHFHLQRSSRNLQLGQLIAHKRDSGVSCMSVCDNDNCDMLVPPTPVGKTQHSVIQQQTRRLGISSPTDQQQQASGEGHTTAECSHREEGHVDLSDVESWTHDWSRDLFSDSV